MVIVMLSSCGNDFDYVFDKTVTERKDEAKAEFNQPFNGVLNLAGRLLLSLERNMTVR